MKTKSVEAASAEATMSERPNDHSEFRLRSPVATGRRPKVRIQESALEVLFDLTSLTDEGDSTDATNDNAIESSRHPFVPRK